MAEKLIEVNLDRLNEELREKIISYRKRGINAVPYFDVVPESQVTRSAPSRVHYQNSQKPVPAIITTLEFPDGRKSKRTVIPLSSYANDTILYPQKTPKQKS